MNIHPNGSIYGLGRDDAVGNTIGRRFSIDGSWDSSDLTVVLTQSHDGSPDVLCLYRGPVSNTHLRDNDT